MGLIIGKNFTKEKFMLEFKTLGKKVNIIKPYLERSTISFCDISLGIKYAWRDEFKLEYAIFNDTLILKESGHGRKDAFYYPIGKDENGALSEIEQYCLKNFKPLSFCYIDDAKAKELSARYYLTTDRCERDWCDYIYLADAFKSYSGKKLSGQRNHVNKFKKNYPNYKFRKIEREDLDAVKDFLDEYARERISQSWTEKVEQQTTLELIENADKLNQKCALIEIDNKVIAVSVGEVVGDTLIVHIEKALKEYSGIYPVMAQEFSKEFAIDGIKYINREEDCGDLGLRTSKLQYKPIEIKCKHEIEVKTLFERIEEPIEITTNRLKLTKIEKEDAEDYKNLYLDENINKLWGYDYREDLGEREPDAEYFYEFQNLLKERKEEFSFAVKLNGKLIGELVLHNFDFIGGVEMGFRFFAEYQGKGYALESASALKDYVFNHLQAKTCKSRCYKENFSSAKLIRRLGLEKTSEDQTHYYFELKK